MTCNGRSRILALMANVLPTVLFAATMLGGDFNGAENLVFANRNSQHNQVCLGDHEGKTFSCSDVSRDSFNTSDVTLGDLNADGQIDAVFANSFQRNRVCLASGGGAFICSDVSPDRLDTFGVALGDVNGDSQLDAVFANAFQRNRVCLGDGRGRFTCADISPHSFNSFAVALGDLNGDRHLDALLVAVNKVEFVLGMELPGSRAPMSGRVCCTVLALRSGDVNGDGRTDAVFANSAQPNRVCLADKTGSLACVDINTDTLRSFEVALGDLNKDGNLDAVFANFDEPNHVCLGDGRGSFSCSDISEDSFATAGVAISTSSRKDLAHAH